MSQLVKAGKLEFDLGELTDFIVEAKKNGYAGGGKKRREADGSKAFVFHKGNFHYTDNYSGSLQAPGGEIVRWQRADGQRIWHMSYSGGMLPEFWKSDELKNRTFQFLKEALMKVSRAHPLRGPPVYRGENLTYVFKIHGDIKRFYGQEVIVSETLGGRAVFSQDVIGCLVVPK